MKFLILSIYILYLLSILPYIYSLQHICNHDTIIEEGKMPPAIPSIQEYPSLPILENNNLRVLTSVQEDIANFNQITTNYQPIRITSIFIDVSSTSTGMDTTKVNFLKNTLAPKTAEIWNNLLKVNPVVGKLYANKRCAATWNDGKCAELDTETQCGFSNGGALDDVKILIEEKYMGSQTYYPNDANTAVQTTAGDGITNADFAMFVTAKHTSSCPAQGQSGTLAYALTCQRDQYDRPTFGRVNFCPYAISAAEKDWNVSLAVALHEYAHALGFSQSSWPLFRNWDATHSPKTSRDAGNNVDSNHLTSSYTCNGVAHDQEPYADHSTTVDFFGERGMSKCSVEQGGAALSNCVHKFIGNRVLTAAREHFDCPTLNGAELENHLTTACSLMGSHWEQRIFNPELMTSFVQPISLLSSVTLALFEESGWYKANYAGASGWRKGLDWGYKQGCDFALKPCVDRTSGIGVGTPAHFYSTAVQTVCTLDRTAVGHVVLSTYNNALPSQYQYFTDTKQGGKQYIDYCPFVEAWSNLHCNNETALAGDTYAKFYGVSYGAGRMCLESTLIETGYAGVVGSGCYKYECHASDNSGYSLTVTAIGRTVTTSITCNENEKGIQKAVPNGFNGKITCPDVKSVCTPPEVLIPSFVSSSGNTNTVVTPTSTPSPTPTPTTTKSVTPTPSHTPTPSSTPSTVPAVVQATLLISGLTVQDIESNNPDTFKSTVANGIATLLGKSPSDIKINRYYIATNRRLAVEERLLAPGDLAVDFSVTTTMGTSSTITNTITNALTGGSNAAPYASTVTSMLNSIATATGKTQGSLGILVNPASISTAAIVAFIPNNPTTDSDGISSGAIAGIVIGAIIVIGFSGLIYMWQVKRHASKVGIALTETGK